MLPTAEQGPPSTQKELERPDPTDRERAHVKALKKRIDEALELQKERFANFKKWRAAYRGFLNGEDKERSRSNMIYAQIAAMMPQVYAKNPDFSFSPSPSTTPKQYELVKKFAATAEIVVTRQLNDAKLKQAMKADVRATMTTGIGWIKATFQEDKRTDPQILNRINDLQDNLERMRATSKELRDAGGAQTDDLEAKAAELEAQMQALQQAPELTIGRGMTLDRLQSEDVIVLDSTIRAFEEYLRADAIAHRVWFSEDKYVATFGYKPKKGRKYAKVAGSEESSGPDKGTYYCVYEIWDHTCNTIFTICEGEEGYCRAPYVPDKVGRRFYPFFALAFNPADGEFYPLSDVELLLKLAQEYNQNRDDLVKHREDSLPVRLARKGGALTEEDVRNIANRQSNDIIMINGVAGRPLSEDIAEFSNIRIDPQVYDTMPARSDMEQIMGGGDAARGTVMKAKTATEAEIMAQGLRGRTEERQDTIEDYLQDLGQFTFEVCLRELSPQEVQRIAGPDAVWPEVSMDEALSMVSLEIKAGTSGKTNKLQEQDRWIQLLPIVKEAMMSVVEFRNAGQTDLADGILELLRETFHIFDERIDVDKFIPPASSDLALEDMSPDQLKAALVQAQATMQQLQDQVAQLSDPAAQADAQAERDLKKARALKMMDADPALQPLPPQQAQPVQPEQPEIDPVQALAPVLQELMARFDEMQATLGQVLQTVAADAQDDAGEQPLDLTPVVAAVQGVQNTIQQSNQAVLQAIEATRPRTKSIAIKTPSGELYQGESVEQ